MYWKIKDTCIPGDQYCTDRYALINIDHIEAISYVLSNPNKIKVHLSCGKEFRADKSNLDVLKEKLDNADDFNLDY